MKAIAVDDEIYMLETLLEAVSASSDIETVEGFSSCSAALAYATENPVDAAFLDINMRGIGGLGLAEKLLETANFFRNFLSCSPAARSFSAPDTKNTQCPPFGFMCPVI